MSVLIEAQSVKRKNICFVSLSFSSNVIKTFRGGKKLMKIDRGNGLDSILSSGQQVYCVNECKKMWDLEVVTLVDAWQNTNYWVYFAGIAPVRVAGRGNSSQLRLCCSFCKNQSETRGQWLDKIDILLAAQSLTKLTRKSRRIGQSRVKKAQTSKSWWRIMIFIRNLISQLLSLLNLLLLQDYSFS